MSVTEQHESRMNFLLLLRVVATFAVVFGHASGFYHAFSFTQWPNFPYIQSVAVTVFFCVSGYTIAWVCDRSNRSGSSGLGMFTFDRIARLHIPLVPFLLICALVEPALLGGNHPHGETLTVKNWIGNILFLQWRIPDFSGFSFNPNIPPFGLNRPLWTLAIEFWTYILFAGAFFGLQRRPIQLLPLAASAVAAIILGVTLYSGQGKGLPIIWLMGAATYFTLKRLPPVDRRMRIAAAILLLPTLALIFTPRFWPPTGDYSKPFNLLVFTCFLLLIILMSGRKPTREPTLTFLGVFAYSVYITHYPILYLMHESDLFPSGETGAVLATVACFACGWIYSLPFEQNYKSIRQKIRTWIYDLSAHVRASWTMRRTPR